MSTAIALDRSRASVAGFAKIQGNDTVALLQQRGSCHEDSGEIADRDVARASPPNFRRNPHEPCREQCRLFHEDSGEETSAPVACSTVWRTQVSGDTVI